MGKAALIPIDQAIVERAAQILGPFSAGAHALAELRKRREAGEDVRLFAYGNSYVVGPSPTPFAGGRENG